MKPETPLPWDKYTVPGWSPYDSPDIAYIVHACNAYPKIIETFLKSREAAALVGEPIGIVEGLLEDLFRELGEL